MAGVLFHAPCFDGLVSAALATEAWRRDGRRVELKPVGYAMKARWLDNPPTDGPFAVVDFLYHPDATWWADHHLTTFLNPPMHADFERRRGAGEAVLWDPASPSCADLLWRSLGSEASRADLVNATIKTDQASYSSPEEAVFGDRPELRINRSLGVDPTHDYLVSLVEDLMVRDLADVAERADVAGRAGRADDASAEALTIVRRDVRQHADVLVLEWSEERGPLNRYLPWLVADGRYSVVLRRGRELAKLTVMRNPWRAFPSLPIGELLEPWGGGGHERVGSVILPQPDASRVAEAVVRELVKQERGAA
jgi:hypothetical protein